LISTGLDQGGEPKALRHSWRERQSGGSSAPPRDADCVSRFAGISVIERGALDPPCAILIDGV
jgi:hypothetical protein